MSEKRGRGGRFLTDLNPINAVHFLLPERLSFFILFYKAHSYNVFIYNMYVYIWVLCMFVYMSSFIYA